MKRKTEINRTTQKMVASMVVAFVFLIVETSRGQTRPDLTRSTDILSNLSPHAGDTVTASVSVQNPSCGSANAGAFHVGFYWSTSSSFINVSPFHETSVAGCAANGTVSFNQSITIDPSNTSGTYYLGYKIDDQREVTECNENNNGIFFWTVTVMPPPPSNDQCGGAIAMTAGTPYSVNTANATAAGDPTPGCQLNFGKGVWYSFTPLASGPVTISTCGSDFDTVIQVYTGSCGALAAVSGACGDDNGPICTGNRASVRFTGTVGTTYRILAGGFGGASGNLSIVAATNGANALTIIPIFDGSITSDPQAATIESTINAAIAVYQRGFSDPVSVSIKFQKVSSGVGLSISYYLPVSYRDYRTALVSHATSADDTTALAHLPNGANNPVNGKQNVNLKLPLARALDFTADPPAGEPDGTIGLNISDMNLSAANTDPTKYSLFAAASHEIDEVLGFASALNGLNNGDPTPTGPVFPEDLFRYDQNGARSFTTALSAAAFFSLDGTTDLARFNQDQSGDFGDWYSPGGQTPEVQDAFTTPGAAPVLGVELRGLDVIGFTRASPPKSDQTITFAPINSKTYGYPPFTVSASASSGLPVSFSIFSGAAMIAGNTVTITGAGAVVVRASQSGSASYNPAPVVDQNFAAAKANQAITFNPLPNKLLGQPPFPMNATASSGLSVGFAILSGPATISGNMVTMTGTGRVVVRALQDGNSNYNPAPSLDQNFAVYSPPPVSLTQSGVNLTISWPTSVAGFVLEGAPSLTPVISWSPVSSTPVLVNGQYTVSVPVGNGNMFYRLRK